MEKKVKHIAMCCKCANRKTKPDLVIDDRVISHTFIGCEANPRIKTFAGANRYCPFLKAFKKAEK